MKGLEWIVKLDHAGDFYTHSETLKNQNKHFSLVNPLAETAAVVMKTEPWGISIDCFESVSTGIKDFSNWNDFFEALEIL